MSALRASLIISTWNGRHLLQECLPRVLRAVEVDGGNHELIVVDDASSDDTVEFVRREFPQVRLIALERNLRFAGANNAAARAATGDVLVFLNNDMLVDPGFLGPMLVHFHDPAVFAVTARIEMKPTRVAGGVIRETGLVRARFEDGSFVLRHDEPIPGRPVRVLYAGGGSSAVRRDRFFQLGGFDRLFRPFYFEDLDVSYRAQKMGWQILFEPRSRMIHKHRQTNCAQNFPGGYVERMFGKNSLLFAWKALTDETLVAQHFRALWRRLMHPSAAPDAAACFLRAAAQLPELLVRRRRARRGIVLSDREALSLAAGRPEVKVTDAGTLPYASSGRGNRVLVLGFAPLPFERERMLGALNFRTWHVTQALLAEGHEVTVAAVRVAGAYGREESLPPVLRFRGSHFQYYSIEHSSFDGGDVLQRLCDEKQPDAIVAVHAYPCWAASRLDTDAPLWADLNGYTMSEAQARAAVANDESAISEAWRWERAAVTRADAFSVVSGRQKYVVIGELAALGRLRGGNYGQDHVHYMPNAIEPEPYRHERQVLRGKLVRDGDFVILWAGGYNTWTDVDTLLDGLLGAMREEERIKFVSLGGALRGRDEHTFYRFRTRAEQSEFADRFVFTGWVPTQDVPNYYFESDVGINIDRYSYEMLIGCRYRILDMLRAGLPVVTTLGTEISYIVDEHRLGATFAPGDADGLKNAILTLARDETRRRRSAARAREYVTAHRLVAQVMGPLQQWARNPVASPDRLAPAVEAERVRQPHTAAGRVVTAFETRGALGAVGAVARVALGAVADMLSKAIVRRDGAPLWGLDAREPPHATLVIRAGAVATAQRVVRRTLASYPTADISVLTPDSLVEETRHEIDAPTIAATAGEACGYSVTSSLINALRERRFDTVVVAGEGNRRAELVALLSGADRRVEVRDDGAAHVFHVAAYKPLFLLARLAAGVLEKMVLSALVAVVWGSIAAEGWLWRLRSGPATTAADVRE